MAQSMQSDPLQSGPLHCGLQDAVAEVVWFDRSPAPVCEHKPLAGPESALGELPTPATATLR
jgi:hypothetical protein